VTLDINMRRWTIDRRFLSSCERPVAVVMVSSLTNEGALATFEALNLGAVDFVAKPAERFRLSIDKIAAELVSKGAQRARARRGQSIDRWRVGQAHAGGAQEGSQASAALAAPRGTSDAWW